MNDMQTMLIKHGFGTAVDVWFQGTQELTEGATHLQPTAAKIDRDEDPNEDERRDIGSLVATAMAMYHPLLGMLGATCAALDIPGANHLEAISQACDMVFELNESLHEEDKLPLDAIREAENLKELTAIALKLLEVVRPMVKQEVTAALMEALSE